MSEQTRYWLGLIAAILIAISQQVDVAQLPAPWDKVLSACMIAAAVVRSHKFQPPREEWTPAQREAARQEIATQQSAKRQE